MTDLTEADGEIITIESRTAMPAPARRAVEAMMPRRALNRFAGWAPEAATLRHHLLRDVVLDGGTMTLLQNGELLRETAYLLPAQDVGEVRLSAAAEDAGEGPVVIGSNHIPRNYYHWLIQAVPAIDAALRRRAGGAPVRLALRAECGFQRDSLAMLGYAGVARLTIEAGRQYRLREAEYSDFLSGGASFLYSASQQATFARLRQAAAAPRGPRARIYAARTDAPVRRMRNESELVERLRRRGFAIVAPGTLSLREQADLFRRASLIVAPHGAGLSNIVFCEPGTFVYELVPALYLNSCFTLLADICGLRYWADMFESPGATPGFSGDWDVDVDLVLRRIDDIERLDPALAPRRWWQRR